MKNNISKIVILTLQLPLTCALCALCVIGFFNPSVTIKTSITFGECFLRCLCLFVFTLLYHHSLTGRFSADSLFIPIHLFFSVLVETRILDNYSKVAGRAIFSPNLIVGLFIFSSIAVVVPLIGYCIYYNASDSRGITRFLAVSLTACVFVTANIPKSQNLANIWNYKAFVYLMYSVYAVAVIVCIILIITDTPGPTLIRHTVAMVLTLSNYINLFYNTFTMNIIGTASLVVACILITVIVRRNAIKL